MERTRVKKLSISLINSFIDQKLDPLSCFLLFIIKGKSLKNIIPDYEFSISEEKLQQNIENDQKDPELYFNIGRLMCHKQNYPRAIEFFNKAISLSKDNVQYKLWKTVVSIDTYKTIPADTQKNQVFCCLARERSPKLKFLTNLINTFSAYPSQIEALWALMEISLRKIVEAEQYIESPRYYASVMKELDKYYGYLSWSYISLNENRPEGIEILLDIINTYPNRPEAYYLAWDYYYKIKKYERSKDIATEAFLKLTDIESNYYYILFSIRIAKSYYYTGEFNNCVELLHKKYLEHPEYPVFLYKFAKYYVVSEDFAMSGACKGILKELIRLCDESRLGSIYYWLFKSYQLTRQYPYAYKYATKALPYLDPNKPKKYSEIQIICQEMKPAINIISNIKSNIANQTITKEILKKCEDVKQFYKPIGELLLAEALYLKGNTDEAVTILKSMISSSRIETSAYFKLLLIDPDCSEIIFKELLERTKNSQIPPQVWVKVNLLYSKFMFKQGHNKKAFYILRVLAKMMPPLPYVKIPYCRSLQNSETFQELEVAFTKISDINSDDNRASFEYFNREMIDESPLSSNPKRERIKNYQGKQYIKYHSSFIDADLTEVNQEDLLTFQAAPDNYLAGFSICSKPKFLYYIAKFSAKAQGNSEVGLLAINDYLELMKLEKNKTKANVKIIKAKQIENKLRLNNSQNS